MNVQGQMQSGGLLPEEKLIKPGQVPNLAFLPAESRGRYQEGVTNLWKQMQHPENSPERLQAWQRLSELSTRLKQQMLKWKHETGQPLSNSQIKPLQQDPAMMMAQQQNPRPTAPQPANQTMDFAQHVRAEASNFQPAIPPEVRQRALEEQKQWVNNQKRHYAIHLQKIENAKNSMHMFTAQVQQRRQERGLNPQETAQAQGRLKQHQANVHETQVALAHFKRQHDQLNQQTLAQQQSQHQAQQQAQQHAQQQAQQPPPIVPAPEEQKPLQKQEPTEVDTPIPIKTENDGVSDEPTDVVPRPSTAGQEQKPLPAQPPQAPNQNSPAAPLPPSARQSGPASTQQVSPQTTQQSGQSAPFPLTHQAAISRAASYNQSSTPGHGHPATQNQSQNIQREQPAATNTMNQRPANRPLNVQPMTAVNMPAARPTLPGGQGPVGSMGQPAIQNYPGFVLQGEGDRVMSKNKLQELVREVTGGAGGEGAETLDPDVEETLLDVADEFIDNVIVAACQLAKIRGADMLDIRDLQVILERNYNIRVPGYASDELRTVKRIQPTTSWTSKMSAVQAAKVTGGKTDI